MGRKAYETFTCSCGESCIMVPHEKSGKLAPITTTLYENGNVEIVWGRSYGSDVYRIVPKAEREAAPKPLHLNHFTNCPQRESFGGRARA